MNLPLAHLEQELKTLAESREIDLDDLCRRAGRHFDYRLCDAILPATPAEMDQMVADEIAFGYFS